MAGRIVDSTFSPPWWLRGSHAQTIFPNTLRRQQAQPVEWEVFELPDGDFVELAWSGPKAGPIALVLHGLGGDWESPPVRGMARALAAEGWRVCRFHFRGCGRSPNRVLKAYHSGMTEDPLAVVHALAERFPERPRVAVGFSLGGNVLLRLLGEEGDTLPLDAGVAVSVPLVLARCADRIGKGLSRVYQNILLKRLRERLYAREDFLRSELPDAFDRAVKARTFVEFDDAFTAPLHGYEDARDYYARASSRPVLRHIARPTLIVHSADDPFMHPDVLPEAHELSDHVTVEVARGGGHVGFVHGTPWAPRYFLEDRVPDWLASWR